MKNSKGRKRGELGEKPQFLPSGVKTEGRQKQECKRNPSSVWREPNIIGRIVPWRDFK